jgi:hypothetical protein
MAKIVTEICKEVRRSVNEDQFESPLQLETVAATLQVRTSKEMLVAGNDFYTVKDELTTVKTILSKAEFDWRKVDRGERAKNLKVLLEKLKPDMQMLEKKIEEATKKGNETEVQKLMEAKDALEDAEHVMQDDLNAILSVSEEDLKNDYEFATGALQAEAATSMMDWLKAFAELLELLLPGRFLDDYGLEDGGCIKNKPHVSVEVLELEDEADKLTESDCDIEFVDPGMDGI